MTCPRSAIVSLEDTPYLMLSAHRTRDARSIAATAGAGVTADFLFTATVGVVQPVTGYWLARIQGWPLTAPWVLESLVLYVFTGACWLPVVAIQISPRDPARDASARGEPPGARDERLFRIWFARGHPGLRGGSAHPLAEGDPQRSLSP